MVNEDAGKIVWTNVRPIDGEVQARVLRTFNAIDQSFRVPAWAGFADKSPAAELVTITCGRCGAPHSYRNGAAGRRKYCDACVRTK